MRKIIFYVLILSLLSIGYSDLIYNQITAQADDMFNNSIVLCANNGAPLTKLSNIQLNSQSSTNVVYPVPQIGTTLNVGDNMFKVTDVVYVYGSTSIYCIKVYVEPIK